MSHLQLLRGNKEYMHDLIDGELAYAKDTNELFIGRDGENVLVNGNIGQNLLINGNFDFWQRGISHTAYGVGSADRWTVGTVNGVTVMAERGTLAADELQGSTFFMRINVQAFSGATNNSTPFFQRLERHIVETLAGKVVTLSFYAKADAERDFSLRFSNSWSSAMTTNFITKGRFTTEWKKYEFTGVFPRPSTNVMQSSPQGSTIIALVWSEDDIASGLAIAPPVRQTGVFDFAQMKLEIGDKATPFIPPDLTEELIRCQRFYEKSYDLDVVPGTGSVDSIGFRRSVAYAHNRMQGFTYQRKRIIPKITLYAPDTGTIGGAFGFPSLNLGVSTVGTSGVSQITSNADALVVNNSYAYHFIADAEM